MNIDTTALDALFDENPDAAKGLSAVYQTLLGGVPSQAGFTDLINNANATNFGSNNPAVTFNAENIYINLANSLVQGNTTASTNFAAISNGTTLAEKVASLYNAIIPEANRTPEGLAFVTRPDALTFYQQVAAERGMAGDEGAAIAALAALLQIAVEGDIGVGADVNDLISAVDDGSSQLPADGETFTDIDVADGTNFDPDATPTPNPTPSNIAPTTSPVTLLAVNEDSGVRLITQAELISNVIDPDGPNHTVSSLAIQEGNGTLQDNNDGTWNFTPAANDDTQVVFSYLITDGIAPAITGTASIGIVPQPETFTANKAGFNTGNATDSVEGSITGATDDMIISTDAFFAGSTVNGQGGNDMLNVATVATSGGFGAAASISDIDAINFQAGGDISGVLGGAALPGIGTLMLTGDLTLTQAQINGFTNVETTGTNTAVITDSIAVQNQALKVDGGSIVIDDAGPLQRDDFEVVTLNGAGNDGIRLEMENGDAVINTINLAGGGSDDIFLSNDDVEATANDFLIVNDFNMYDDQVFIRNDGQFVNRFVSVNLDQDADGAPPITNAFFEIQNGNAVTAATALDVSNGGAVEAAILSALGTVASSSVGSHGNFVMYGDGNAYVYSAEVLADPAGNDLEASDFEVELVAQINNIAEGSLGGNNFGVIIN